MKKKYKFTAEIKKIEGMNAAYVEIPFNVEEEFGIKGQVKVKAKFAGHEYRGSLAKMGMPCHFIGISQELRKIINQNPGDIIEVEIEKDDEPRIVEIPKDFEEALINKIEAKVFFEKLSFTNKKEYVNWITSTKREETRKIEL